ncbi:WXG100-like domain-containing protein [Streptomyces sioyaensis]|uniref:WXG100-like domain-containing protein n=1 Tax=Streptomyces sioyaensis TaxID=67364 RepID=UPI001F1BE2CD|nr:PE-PGRS family protein [Streptomyces sioyaensis]
MAWVLDLLGYNWPDADEDKLHECAQVWRNFAESVNQASSQGSSTANEVVSANSGEAIEGFSQEWGSFSGGGDGGDNYLRDAPRRRKSSRSPSTRRPSPYSPERSRSSSSSSAGRRDHQATDYVKKTVKETVKDKVVDQAKEIAKDKIVEEGKNKAKEAATEMAQNVAQQGIESHFGARDGIDWGETADIGKGKAGEYVDGLKQGAQEYKDGVTSLADPGTYVDHAKEDLPNRGLNAAQRHTDRHTGAAATRNQDVTDEVRSVFG